MSSGRGRAFQRKGSKTWNIAVSLGNGPDGRRLRHQSGGYLTKADAERAKTKILSQLDQGDYTKPTAVTVEEFAVQQWLPSLGNLVAGGSLKPSTVEQYRYLTMTHIVPRLGSVRLKALTSPMLNQFYRDLMTSGRRQIGEGQSASLAPTTVRAAHRTVARMLKDAVRWDLLPRNVATQADPPGGRKLGEASIKAWSPEELCAFVSHVSEDRLNAIWVLFIMTGLRRGEVAGLRWEDIDLLQGSLTVHQTRVVVRHEVVTGTPKTAKSQRTIALDPETAAALKSLRVRQAEERLAFGADYEGNDLLVVWEDGKPIHPDVISKTFKRVSKAANLPPIPLHGLRHSYATAALEAGVALKVVSERLGHSSISITADIYSHVRREVDQEAANQVALHIRGAG